MHFLKRLKEVSLAFLPIAVIVLIIHFAFYRFDSTVLVNFFISLVIISFGQVLFLMGVENSVMEMGNYVGNSIIKFRHIGVYLIFAFLFGMLATIAEPDVQVLSSQAAGLGLQINKWIMVFLIGAGVGVGVAFAMLRIIKRVNYKVVIASLFLLIFVICILLPNSLISIAFDAGGATTGIVSSPFLLAITTGIVQNRTGSSNNEDNFGVIGIASICPVLVMAILSVFAQITGTTEVILASEQYSVFIESLIDTTLAMLPLLLLFFIFDIAFLKLPRKKKISLAIGSVVTFGGLFLFLFAINFGFEEMGNVLGDFLATKSVAFCLVFSVIVGFIVAYTEPAIRILGAEIENVTNGSFSRKAVTFSIAISMAVAIVLGTLKVIFDINIWYIILPGYALALLLMIFSDNIFTSIAFDSGGVASGPISSALLLPIMIGLGGAHGNKLSGFGLLGIVNMMPIIVLQLIGSFYFIKLKAIERKEFRIALRVAYGEDQYSEITKMEEEYEMYIESQKNREESADEEKK